MRRFLLALPLLMALAAPGAHAQAAPPPPAVPSELTRTVARLDAELFAAFNAHDVNRLMGFFADNLEFYHDKGGLSNFAQTRDSFARLFAQSPDISRTLVPGTLEVYPIKGYGATHIATQRFCHQENGRQDCGNSKFVMVWQQQGDTWKITRVVSYDH